MCRQKSIINTCNEADIVYMYTNNGMYIKDIASIYHCRTTRITEILHRNGVRTNNMGKTVNRLANVNYFDNIDTELKAYLLGFITADGSVSFRKDREFGKVLRLEVQERDETVIDMLSSALNISSKKYYRNKNGHKTVSISISSEEIVTSLCKYGIVPRKTYELDSLYLDIDENLIRHYLRGLFDGDGCLTECGGYFHAYFTEGIEKIVHQFHDAINTYANINNNVKVRCNNNVYSIAWNGTNCAKVCEYLYKDAQNFLPRKYEIAYQIMKKYSLI